MLLFCLKSDCQMLLICENYFLWNVYFVVFYYKIVLHINELNTSSVINIFCLWVVKSGCKICSFCFQATIGIDFLSKTMYLEDRTVSNCILQRLHLLQCDRLANPITDNMCMKYLFCCFLIHVIDVWIDISCVNLAIQPSCKVNTLALDIICEPFNQSLSYLPWM